MKKITLFKKLTVVLSFCLLLTNSFASIHTVLVEDFQFNPSTVTADLGDTILFVNAGAIQHTTTSNSVPTGATTWDSPINSTNTSFQYVINIEGTYNYKCTFHQAGGMAGVIQVGTVGISQFDINKPSSVAYPNPFKDKTILHLPIITNKVDIYNLMGKAVRSYKVSVNETTLELDLSNLPAGIYFYSLISESGIIETKKLVKIKL